MRHGRIQNVFCFYFIRFCDSIWALVLQNYNFILLGIHVEDDIEVSVSANLWRLMLRRQKASNTQFQTVSRSFVCPWLQKELE